MKVIAISGRAGAGKDSLAAIIKGGDDRVRIYPFARKLKAIAGQLWQTGDLSDYAAKALYRSRLIQLGALVRSIDPWTWVDAVVREIRADADAGAIDAAIVTDLRFFNELHRLLAAFGDEVRLVRVSAPAAHRLERMGPVAAEAYVSTGAHLDESERQMDLLEAPDAQIPQDLLETVRTVRSTCLTIRNDRSLRDLGAAASFVRRFAEGSPVGAEWSRVVAASYRLARGLGPEAKLYV